MPNLLSKRTIKSQQYTYVANSAFQVPINFLEPAMSGMRNPKLIRLRAHVGITANTGTSGGPARQFAQVFARVLIQDCGGDRVNLKGSSLRIVQYAEKTGVYRDGLDLGASLSNATQDIMIDLLPVNVLNESGDNDHGILVSDLLNGGQIQLTWGAATTITNYITWQSATYVELFADVIDAVDAKGRVELPPRNVYIDEAVSLTDARYKFGGLLRWAIYYNGDQGEDTRQGFAAQNFYSADLNINGWPLIFFADSYRNRALRAVDGDSAAVIQTEDPFLRPNPQAIALFQPENSQAISSLPPTDTLQMRTTGTISSLNPVMIKCLYTQRSAQGEQAALQASSAAMAQAIIQKNGMVAGGAPVSSVTGGLAPFLPLKVKAA